MFSLWRPDVSEAGRTYDNHISRTDYSVPCTDPDTALHKVAQALIIQSIDSARNNHAEYRLGYPCPSCGEEVSYNIAPTVTHVEPEESVVEGTRSDIVLYRDGRNAIIVEVVVTHDLEQDTRHRYIESGLPVFLIQPAWDNLDELKLSVIADTTLNLTVYALPFVYSRGRTENANKKKR